MVLPRFDTTFTRRPGGLLESLPPLESSFIERVESNRSRAPAGAISVIGTRPIVPRRRPVGPPLDTKLACGRFRYPRDVTRSTSRRETSRSAHGFGELHVLSSLREVGGGAHRGRVDAWRPRSPSPILKRRHTKRQGRATFGHRTTMPSDACSETGESRGHFVGAGGTKGSGTRRPPSYDIRLGPLPRADGHTGQRAPCELSPSGNHAVCANATPVPRGTSPNAITKIDSHSHPLKSRVAAVAERSNHFPAYRPYSRHKRSRPSSSIVPLPNIEATV